MKRFLGGYESYIYALLRVVAGFMFMQHGTQKLFGLPPSGKPAGQLDAFTTLTGGLELVLGAMVLIGLFTSIAAFLASGMMAVAYFMVHQKMGALPIQNQGELAALYSFVFLFIAAYGSGICSVDSVINKGST